MVCGRTKERTGKFNPRKTIAEIVVVVILLLLLLLLSVAVVGQFFVVKSSCTGCYLYTNLRVLSNNNIVKVPINNYGYNLNVVEAVAF